MLYVVFITTFKEAKKIKIGSLLLWELPGHLEICAWPFYSESIAKRYNKIDYRKYATFLYTHIYAEREREGRKERERI